MTLEDVAAIPASIGIPWCYDHFDENVPPPYMVYYYPDEQDFIADNENFVNIRSVTFELVTKEKDFDLESAVETQLQASGLVWYKSTDWISSEEVYQTTYETGVIINEQQS